MLTIEFVCSCSFVGVSQIMVTVNRQHLLSPTQSSGPSNVRPIEFCDHVIRDTSPISSQNIQVAPDPAKKRPDALFADYKAYGKTEKYDGFSNIGRSDGSLSGALSVPDVNQAELWMARRELASMAEGKPWSSAYSPDKVPRYSPRIAEKELYAELM